ncbi:hypothetical protein LQ327_15585 [Actinomycetospora endophytica]|uniref:Uncharacterized protein n=1 Tax=Actinomycetospora endophytica TaxID=2291215 RepID=A0ABS8P990_9PSEU|nr:hypothetical protein [Actinomycetospora endophytica]MCD2194793.1 hypothetical protein [Actinomycetospora endophytica]
MSSPGSRRAPSATSSPRQDVTAWERAWGLLPRSWAASLLRLVLGLFGVVLPPASRWDPVLRRQITRSLVVDITTDDGVARRWSFDGPGRRARSTTVTAGAPDHALRFATSGQALATLLSTRTVDRVVAGVVTQRMRIEGSAFVVIWFHGLTRRIVRIGRRRGPRVRPPGAYLSPDPSLDGDETITREPAVTVLDPTWTDAWRARARLWMPRGGAGEPMPEP